MTSEFAIAVHALVYLNHRDEILSSETLAENICTNPARVRKIMAKLKKSGLVGTKEGLNGGYSMTKKADEINLKQICDALQTELVKAGWKSGNKDLPCMIACGMSAVMDELYLDLDEKCKNYLESITVLGIEKRIFGQDQKTVVK